MHWLDRSNLTCRCGHVSRSAAAEARHRHNFPMLCRPAKSPTGRLSTGEPNEPNEPNVPGSIADALDKAFKRGLK